ncbi:hypothetical protein [Jeotgalibacillus soli]|nr:hypothetical protein [Jeotgalibacillus soli]
MAYLWVVTVGFVGCIVMIGGVFFYFIRSGLNPNDAIKVDSQNCDH